MPRKTAYLHCPSKPLARPACHFQPLIFQVASLTEQLRPSFAWLLQAPRCCPEQVQVESSRPPLMQGACQILWGRWPGNPSLARPYQRAPSCPASPLEGHEDPPGVLTASWSSLRQMLARAQHHRLINHKPLPACCLICHPRSCLETVVASLSRSHRRDGGTCSWKQVPAAPCWQETGAGHATERQIAPQAVAEGPLGVENVAVICLCLRIPTAAGR